MNSLNHQVSIIKIFSQIKGQTCFTFLFQKSKVCGARGKTEVYEKRETHTVWKVKQYESIPLKQYFMQKAQRSTCNDLSLVLRESMVSSARSCDFCRPFFRDSVSWKMVCSHVLFQKNASGNTDISFIMCSTAGEEERRRRMLCWCQNVVVGEQKVQSVAWSPNDQEIIERCHVDVCVLIQKNPSKCHQLWHAAVFDSFQNLHVSPHFIVFVLQLLSFQSTSGGYGVEAAVRCFLIRPGRCPEG